MPLGEHLLELYTYVLEQLLFVAFKKNWSDKPSSSRLLLPLMMQVISLPLFCSKLRKSQGDHLVRDDIAALWDSYFFSHIVIEYLSKSPLPTSDSK